jgi:flavin reductase (DIM6/NTAB) family NADH-FMN oxidoreductase RutF
MNASNDPKIFRHVLGHYPTGVCVITATQEDGTPVGMSVGTFTSVSLDPPLVGFFPDRKSSSWPKIEQARRFCVNVLAEHQEPLCRVFASKVQDKFAGVPHRLSAAGQPIFDGIIAWIDCDLHSVHEAGDHYLVLGQVHSLDIERPGKPLLFFQGGYGQFQPLAAEVAG